MTTNLDGNGKKKRTFERVCPGCNEIFQATRRDQIYCDKSCSQFVHRQRNYLNKDQEAERTKLSQANNKIDMLTREKNHVVRAYHQIKKEMDSLTAETRKLVDREAEMLGFIDQLKNDRKALRIRLDELEDQNSARNE